MLADKILTGMDVLNVSVSGFLIVFLELAILFGFINLMSWMIRKIQKQD